METSSSKPCLFSEDAISDLVAFTVISISTVLRRLSTGFWSVAVEICVHSAIKAVVRLGERSDVQSASQFNPMMFSGIRGCLFSIQKLHFNSLPIQVYIIQQTKKWLCSLLCVERFKIMCYFYKSC